MAAEIDFISRYDHTLDAKHRLMIPQAYRDMMTEAGEEFKFFLTQGMEECVDMYPRSMWERMVALLRSRKADELGREETRKFFRLFRSNAVKVVPDKAGRIVIPAHLRGVAGLEKDLVLIGASDHVEVWDRERWAKYSACGAGEYEAGAREVFAGLLDRGAS